MVAGVSAQIISTVLALYELDIIAVLSHSSNSLMITLSPVDNIRTEILSNLTTSFWYTLQLCYGPYNHYVFFSAEEFQGSEGSFRLSYVKCSGPAPQSLITRAALKSLQSQPGIRLNCSRAALSRTRASSWHRDENLVIRMMAACSSK